MDAPLWVDAVGNGRTAAVEQLLKQGAFGPNDRWTSDPGGTWKTPLSVAIYSRSHRVVALLLEHKADPSADCVVYARLKSTLTPLACALDCPSPASTVAALLRAGALQEPFCYEGKVMRPRDFLELKKRTHLWNQAVGRLSCERAVVTLVGTRRFRHTVLNSNARDIVVLVAQVLWSTRDDAVWRVGAAAAFDDNSDNFEK